jgi:hypothetical protein
MSTTEITNPADQLYCALNYVYQTRRFGVTYVHADVRRSFFSWQGIPCVINGRAARVTWGSWGKSLNSKRGHKYKAWCRWEDTGKPVPTAALQFAKPV